jgi:hypothetical protein
MQAESFGSGGRRTCDRRFLNPVAELSDELLSKGKPPFARCTACHASCDVAPVAASNPARPSLRFFSIRRESDR